MTIDPIITCPPGQLVVDVSLWDDHVNVKELFDGGVVSVIVGLYQGDYVNGKVLLNDNCKRIADAVAASGILMQSYYYVHPEKDPYREADWYAEIVHETQYPIKFFWADCEDFKVAMTPAARSEKYRLFTERFHSYFKNTGVYAAKWFTQQWAPDMDKWLPNYLAWFSQYSKEPAQVTLMSWDQLKANWLPNYPYTSISPGQVGRVVGHQFTGDRCCLPGVYSKYDYLPWTPYKGRRPVDISVFNTAFLNLVATGQVPSFPPTPTPSPVPIPTANTWYVNIPLVHTRSTPRSSDNTNLLTDMPQNTHIQVDSFSPDGLWAHFLPLTKWPKGGWVFKQYITKVAL